MLKDLSEFPQLVETLINSLIGFLYRTLATYWTVVWSPRFGSLKAHMSKASLQPLTALFLSSSILAATSVLFPDQVAGAVQNRGKDIASWLFCIFALLLPIDAAINIGSHFGRGRPRYRRRARAMLRYASSAALLGIALMALEWRWETRTLFAVAPMGAHFPERPYWLNALLLLIIMVPVAGTTLTLIGKANLQALWPWGQGPEREPWPRSLLRTTVSALPFVAILVLAHTGGATIAKFDLASAVSEAEPSPPDVMILPEDPIRISPVVCSRDDGGAARFTAGVTNVSKKPVAFEPRHLSLKVLPKDVSLLDPKAVELEVVVDDPIVPLPPDSVRLITGRISLPPQSEDLDLDACYF